MYLKRCVSYSALVLLLASPAFPGEKLTFNLAPRETVEARLRQFAGNNKQREQTLATLFRQAGCDGDRISEQPVKGSKQPNIICVLRGEGDEQIIVGAHFDRVSEGSGVVDNWSGASMLPSLLEAVSTAPRKHTFIFIGFTDEEQGLIGSKFYAAHLTKEQAAKVDAMINLDTLGLSPTKVWASHADPRLMNALWSLSQSMDLPLAGMNVDNVGSSDSESFERLKIPRMTVHSVTQETWSVLHSRKDTIEAIHLDDYYNTYRLLSAFLAYVDVLPRSAPPETKSGR
jgi:hypothetical protein